MLNSSRIRVDAAEATNLIKMWGPQLAEHSLFLHLLLHEPTLKAQGQFLHDAWKKFLLGGRLLDEQRLFALLDETRAYKEGILRRLNAGEWLGATYPTFVRHVLRELVYFEEKLAGMKFTSGDEVAFWNVINSEHATFASHLLDPVHSKLHDEAEATSRKIGALPANDDLGSVVMAIEAGADLDAWNKNAEQQALLGKLKSIIHPTLQSHVIREGEYGQAILKSLIDQDSAPVRPSSIK